MGIDFLKTLVIIFGLSALVVFILNKWRIPSIVGFLIAGAFLGPHGFGFIKALSEVELLAEIGVILLLFTIGLEISLKNLKRIRSAVLGGGLLQLIFTLFVTVLITYPILRKINHSIFIGLLVTLSSTAIVMRLLFEHSEMDSPHGRISIGILIFQDLCVVPFMLLTPILAGQKGSIIEILGTIGLSAAILLLIIFGARWLVPNILHQIVRTRSRELFIITIILLCLGTALLTSSLGLSLALGAFIAGIIISESEYAYQVIADILPFKDSFNGLFFISVGMLMNLKFFTENILTILIIFISILVLKVLTTSIAVHILRNSLRTSILSGLHLAQIGEFSFVLAVAGKSSGLLTDENYQLFLSASILTMLLTPLLFQLSPNISTWVSSKRLLERLDRMRKTAEKEGIHLKREGHVIIIGFGLNGRNLAEVLKEVSIPYVVLDLNNDTVLKMKKRGEPIFYGDGTSPEILQKLGIEKARVLVIAISDPSSTRRILQTSRKLNPRLYVIVRTRYIAEVDDLIKLGANEVIPEEFETSVEIFAKVLHYYQIPKNFILNQIEKIRSQNYEALRRVEFPQRTLPEKCEILMDVETETYLVNGNTYASGRSLRELDIRSSTGATVIAVKRENEIISSPEPEFVFKPGDVIYLIGSKESILQAIELLEIHK
jgi:CPA2 family monovalent cation:H+ antiporter-2